MVIWQRLVQVCQRWQQIIYGSPKYLDLHPYCSPAAREPFRKHHSHWPDFPLILNYQIGPDEDEAVDCLVAALEHSNRVHHLDLYIGSWDSRVYEVLKRMRVSFPALTHLKLEGPDTYDKHNIYDISRNFLGNIAPCLQHIHLDRISFQELPKLLLSTRGLVSLQLEHIPTDVCGIYGYISPEAMVGGLDGLVSLRTLCVEFRFLEEPSISNERLEKERCPDPPLRAVLPALTEFVFCGEIKYLEDLIARIDLPGVEDIKIEYYPPWFDVPELSQFIDRTASLEFAQFRRAKVTFEGLHSQIQLDRPQGECQPLRFSLGVEIEDTGRDPHMDVLVPCMTRAYGQLTSLLSNVGHLSFQSQHHQLDLDNSKFLPLHLFPSVEELHVSGALAENIATMLENITAERVTELMPVLHSLWLGNGDEPVGSTEQFLSLRQLSGRPVMSGNTQDGVVG